MAVRLVRVAAELPGDFIGAILYSMLRPQLDSAGITGGKRSSRLTVVIETEYYPVTLEFGDVLKIRRGAEQRPTLRVTTTLQTVVEIARHRISPVGAFFRGRIKIRGFLRHPLAARRFLALFLSSLGRGLL